MKYIQYISTNYKIRNITSMIRKAYLFAIFIEHSLYVFLRSSYKNGLLNDICHKIILCPRTHRSNQQTSINIHRISNNLLS